jgi:hypothetical protein
VIGIVDLVDVCDRRYADDLGWFTLLGRWVTDEPDPARQRWFAVASHRHAWHAELWAQRRPAIPHDADHVLPDPAAVEPTGDRAAAYAAHLVAVRAELADLRAAIDPELDPSTLRTLTLVDADLAALQPPRS